MGDSWDETSFDVSEADVGNLAKQFDSDDLDKELFGSLSGVGGTKKASLVQAMKKSTGRSFFDDSSKPGAKEAVKQHAAPIVKNAPKQTKKVTDDEDDLLADLLDDDDLIPTTNTPAKKRIIDKPEPVQKPAPAKIATPARTPQTNSKKPKDSLFDDDDPLDILGTEPIQSKTPQTSTKTPQNQKSGSKFDNLLNRTSFVKESTDPAETPLEESYDIPRNTSTPVRRRGEPKSDIGNVKIDPSFTPSTGAPQTGRSRPGLNSGYSPSVSTPGTGRGGRGTSAKGADDTFSIMMEDNKNESVTDMFRVDKEPASRAQGQDRPFTQAGTRGGSELDGGSDVFVSSRPPSAGRRGGPSTPQKRNSPPGTPNSVQHDKRRQSIDSIFTDEDDPAPAAANTLPWNAPAQPATPQVASEAVEQVTPRTTPRSTPLPWETGQATPQAAASASGGPATQMILQQNTLLEKKIKDLEKETTQLKATILSLEAERSSGSEEREKERSELESQVKKMGSKIEELEGELNKTEALLKKSEESANDAQSILEKRVAQMTSQHKEELSLVEKNHADRLSALNILLEEKEKMIQNEMKSASKRLKEKEVLILDEMRGERCSWDARMSEAEKRHSYEYEKLIDTHAQTIGIMQNDHSNELIRQRELRQQELSAVLSVQKHTQSLTQLMEKVELSADEVTNLTQKLETGRSVTLEEREKAANIMSEYLHDLQSKLSVQQRDITEERERIQEVVGRMESHLRVQNRQSEATQSKLLIDEARLQSLQTRLEAERLEQERGLARERERIDKAKAALVSEQREMIEKFYTERKELAKERARLSTASQRATEQHARGAVKHLDIEAQAQAMLDHAKREVSQIELKKEIWNKEERQRQALNDNMVKQSEELEAEKERVLSANSRVNARSKEVEACSDSLSSAREDCMKIQHQLAELETNLRMREDDVLYKELNLREQQESLNSERELVHYDKQSLHEQGVKCPACQKYRPRSGKNSKIHSPIRSSSPLQNKLFRSPSRSVSPLNMSTGSVIGSSRYRYPSASVLELTGSLQRFGVLSDQETLQVQSNKISKLRENQQRILSSSG